MRRIASGCCSIITIILCFTTGWQGVGATLIDALNRSRYLPCAIGIRALRSPRAPRASALALIMRPLLFLLVAAAGCSPGAPTPDAAPTSGEPGVVVDHHVHAFGPEVRSWLERELDLPPLPELGVEALIQAMDEGGVARAAILSNAYFFARTTERQPADAEAFRAENSRVAAAVARYPERLVGFCGLNPLADEALAELARCGDDLGLTGIKLHLANSGVDLRNEEHLERLGQVFAAANRRGLGIVIHLRTANPDYGAEDARHFADRVLPLAPDVTVQVAHMAGWGGYDPATDAALGELARPDLPPNVIFDLAAVVRPVREPGTPEARELPEAPDAVPAPPAPDATASPDATSVPAPTWWPEARYERLVEQMRALGIERIVFGTDWPEWTAEAYRADLSTHLPLTLEEFAVIDRSWAPWFR